MSESPAGVPRTIEVPTADGVIRGSVHVPAGPMRLAGLVPIAWRIADALVDRANRLEVLQGREISCRAGCAACCRHHVPVSPPEALYLLDLLDGFDPTRKAATQARFDEIERVVSDQGLIEELLHPDPRAADDVLPVARKYFALGLACPFLRDEACGIHAHRPAACRDYNVTSPSAWCAAPYEHAIAKVPMPLPLSIPLARTASRLSQTPAELVPLSLLPVWGRRNAALRARTWDGLKAFDAFAAELAETYGPSPC